MFQSRSKTKVDGPVLGVILFLTENSILKNESSEKTWNEELNKLFLVKIQLRENYIWLGATWRFRTQSEEIQNMRWLCRDENLNLKDGNYWKPINGQSKFSVREYTCVLNWRWRTVFTRNATQEVAKKLKNWEAAAEKKKNWVTRQKLSEYFMQQD